jgi:hypothetical protein
MCPEVSPRCFRHARIFEPEGRFYICCAEGKPAVTGSNSIPLKFWGPIWSPYLAHARMQTIRS